MAVIAAALVLLWSFQRSLIYLPSGGPVPAAAAVIPGAEDVTFEAAAGVRLRGWFVPARESAAATVIVLNGNAGHRGFRAPLARALSAAGHSVLLFDYRGYGGNPGEPTEAGLLADARGALAYLEHRPDVDPARIAYYGESLGAAVAVALAVERPPLALILRSPFTSLADIGRHHYPLLPVHEALLRDRFRVAQPIAAVRAPTLVIAGDRDRIVPPAHSRSVYDAAPDPKRYVSVRGADHNDAALLDGDELVRAVTAFISAAARG